MNTKKEPIVTILYTTVAREIDAEALANLAIKEKLAVCINIMPSSSFYLWNGNMRNQVEYSLLFKTLPPQAEKLKNLIVHHHPYDIPALLQWDSHTTFPFFDYLQMEIQGEF